MRRLTVLVFAALVLVAAAAPAPASERGAAWCGSATSTDAPDALTGYQWHVIYAVPSDASDRFASVAPLIASDLAAIDAWWRGQDPTRTPRFDLLQTSACSGFGALDITDVRLPRPSSAYSGGDAFSARREIGNDLGRVMTPSKKYLVYYDGAVAGPVCGFNDLSPTRGGTLSFLFLGTGSCRDVGTGGWPARAAAFDMLMNMGAMWDPGAPHACSYDRLKVCDTRADVLAGGPYCCNLADAVLDFGRDDYYGQGGPRWDVRNSLWLRHLDTPPVTLEVRATGAPGATVTDNDVPGVDCTGDCTSTWDEGPIQLTLHANAPDGYELRSWGGACRGHVVACSVTLDASKTVTATFGPLQYELEVHVAGEGTVSSVPRGIACPRRCSARLEGGSVVRLRAKPARGYRFAGWGGGCSGRRPVCRLTLDAGTAAVSARFRHG